MSAATSEEKSQSNLSAVMKLIGELAQKSSDANFIFRGERKTHPKVSSSLYRLYEDIDAEGFDIEVVQSEIINEARFYTRYTGELDDLEILSQLQHNGGATNLIDFTTDFLIALFFACDGEPEELGRVVLLPEIGSDYQLELPNTPVHRVIAQKSIFVRPQKGFVEPFETVFVSSSLKPMVLDYLRTRHGISAETVYNDLHGFIRYQGIHQSAYTEFHKAMTANNNGDYQQAIEHYTSAISLSPQRPAAYNNRGNVYCAMGNYRSAISDFERALELNPEYAAGLGNLGYAYHCQGNYALAIEFYGRALLLEESGQNYCNRGESWLHLGEWDKAKQDLIRALEWETDVVASFRNEYDNIEDFQRKNNLDPPEELVEMLGG